MNIQEKVKNWIEKTLKIKDNFVLTHPKNIKNGDYSFFCSPEKANEFRQALTENKISEIEKIEIAGNFINFYLSKDFFAESVKEILDKEEKFGENSLLEDQKIIIEYTDPNPFKEFHIGHLMSNSIGEAISRIIEFHGAEVKRANWQGDMGLHVAKAVFAMKLGVNFEQAYVFGHAVFENQQPLLWYLDGYEKHLKPIWDNIPNLERAKEEIIAINKKIYEKSDSRINDLYESGRKTSLDYFEGIYERLGTKFVYYFFEGKEGVEGKSIVENHIKDGIFEKSDGAIIFRGEKYGLHTRVFINSDGIPTYEAKELGLNKKKFDVEPKLIKSIIITGNEIKEYFKVLIKVISLIFPDIAEKTLHLPHGMLRLPGGKMSSRTGNIITAKSLIEQMKAKIAEKLKDREYSVKEKGDISEIVAIGAIKYSILRQAIGGDIIFDFDKSISFEGNSGPYLQYTYVRANSVLEKAKMSRLNLDMSKTVFDTWETTELEKYLYRFPEVVERAGKEYAPHYIVTYLTELSSIFNSFYAKNKIIDESDPSSPYKIALTAATASILKSGLHLLGIKVPERM